MNIKINDHSIGECLKVRGMDKVLKPWSMDQGVVTPICKRKQSVKTFGAWIRVLKLRYARENRVPKPWCRDQSVGTPIRKRKQGVNFCGIQKTLCVCIIQKCNLVWFCKTFDNSGQPGIACPGILDVAHD